jgi:hypothetical protein
LTGEVATALAERENTLFSDIDVISYHLLRVWLNKLPAML